MEFLRQSCKVNVEIPGYSYFPYLSHGQNGSVALYVKSGLSPTPRPDLSRDSTSFETVWVEVENRNGSNYLFCCAYRHPSSDLDSFNEYLQEILSNPAVSNKKIFILGDFNVNLLNFNSHTPTTNYINFLFSKQFLPYIIHPSQVSDNSSTLIDNIFSNISDNETVSGDILTNITDHFPQFLIVKHAVIPYKNLSYYQHDFFKLNAENLLNDFENLDLSFLNDSVSDANAKFDSFLSILNELVKTHAPLKKNSPRKTSNSEINHGLMEKFKK